MCCGLRKIVGLTKQRIGQILNEKDEDELSKENSLHTKVDSRKKTEPEAILNDWLKDIKQVDIAEDRGITQPRVSQIVRDFKDHLHNQYLVKLFKI